MHINGCDSSMIVFLHPLMPPTFVSNLSLVAPFSINLHGNDEHVHIVEEQTFTTD